MASYRYKTNEVAVFQPGVAIQHDNVGPDQGSAHQLQSLRVLQHRLFPFHTMSPIPSPVPPEKFPQSFPYPPLLEVEEIFPGACAECPLSTTLFLTIITVAIWPHAPPGRCPCSISPIWCSCLCEFNQHSGTSCSQPDIPFTDHWDQPSSATVKLGSANMVVKRSISSFLAASVVKKHGGVRGMCI